VILPVFKTGERRVRPVAGAFDSHTLPPILRSLGLLVAIIVLWASSLGAQSAAPHPSGIQDILQYINNGWTALSRSMDDCKTVVDAKFPARSLLYVPAGAPVPSAAREVSQRCGVSVQALPHEIRTIGTVDMAAIKQPGLLYLPNPYVVPGGFFNEMYGWDSYFIIRGLLRTGKLDLARGMVENFFYEIEHYGAILNANRSYFLTRSQPPFLSSMVLAVHEAQLRAGKPDDAWLRRAYDYIVRDHTMWTTGQKLAGDTGLSRYYDFGEGPAPELYGHNDRYYDAVATWFTKQFDRSRGYLSTGADSEALPAAWPRYTVQLCGGMTAANPSSAAPCRATSKFSFTADYYRGDRAMRESGYDVSFRFGPFSGSTHHYAALDLNALLYKAERDLERIARMLGKDADARRWAERARLRRNAINRLMWDEKKGLYFDYDFVRVRRSDYVFITTFHALWTGVASPKQAERIASNLRLFEHPGGLVTSLTETKVQWDYPWGWAPNQLIAVEGLRRYRYNSDADRVALKFLSTVLTNFRRDGTIREKYNVVARTSTAEIQAGYKENVVRIRLDERRVPRIAPPTPACLPRSPRRAC